MINKEEVLSFHKGGKLELKCHRCLRSDKNISLAYTPGVAEACREIVEHPEAVYDLTMKGNFVAVVTDGSAVLGLGDIGPEASLPVMEGKAQLLHCFGKVNAVPISLRTRDTEEIINTVKNIAPAFGGILLEDISAPRCFEIEERLSRDLDIPVFHDDQHGTAIVLLAGLSNAFKISGKESRKAKIIISGAGAAGMSIARMLIFAGYPNIIMLDSAGIIYDGREEGMNEEKRKIALATNKERIKGGLGEALKGADVFIGVSKPGILKKEMIRSMAPDPMIFAMANPVPEIMPEEAKEAGAFIVATGRSDYSNQINNVLAFPGLFRGLLDSRKKEVTMEMKKRAAMALADFVKDPRPDHIVPHPFEKGVAEAVAAAIKDN